MISMRPIRCRIAVPLRLPAGRPAAAETARLEQDGAYLLPVRINDAIPLKFGFDIGAADAAFPADAVRTLNAAGTIVARI